MGGRNRTRACTKTRPVLAGTVIIINGFMTVWKRTTQGCTFDIYLFKDQSAYNKISILISPNPTFVKAFSIKEGPSTGSSDASVTSTSTSTLSISSTPVTSSTAPLATFDTSQAAITPSQGATTMAPHATMTQATIALPCQTVTASSKSSTPGHDNSLHTTTGGVPPAPATPSTLPQYCPTPAPPSTSSQVATTIASQAIPALASASTNGKATMTSATIASPHQTVSNSSKSYTPGHVTPLKTTLATPAKVLPASPTPSILHQSCLTPDPLSTHELNSALPATPTTVDQATLALLGSASHVTSATSPQATPTRAILDSASPPLASLETALNDSGISLDGELHSVSSQQILQIRCAYNLNR